MRQCIQAEKTFAHVYRLPCSNAKQNRAITEQSKNKIRTLTSLAERIFVPRKQFFYPCRSVVCFYLPLQQCSMFLFTPAAGWCVFIYPCSRVVWTRVPHRQPTIDSARKAQWFVKWSFRLAIYNFYRPSLREILKFQTLVGSFLGGLMWKSLFSIFNLEAGTKGILSIISDSMTFVKACWQAPLKRRIIKKISSSENEIF